MSQRILYSNLKVMNEKSYNFKKRFIKRVEVLNRKTAPGIPMKNFRWVDS